MCLKPNLQKHRSKVLLLSGLALSAGVAAAAYVPFGGWDQRWLLAAMWPGIFLALWLWPKRLAALFLILPFFILGYWRYQLAAEITPADLAFHLEQDLTLSGRLKTEPEISDAFQKFIVQTEPLSGAVAVYADLSQTFHYGDVLELKCFLEKPANFGDFDAARYWRRFGVYGLCRFGELKIIGHDQGHWFYGQVVRLRVRLGELVAANLPYPEADLGGALVFGISDKLRPDLRAAFSASGLTHIIAISGLNVSLLVMLLFNGALFAGLNRKLSLWLALSAVIFYVVVVGAPASAVRAGVMGVLLLLAAWLGRLNNLINALVLAAALTLLANPFLLRDDIGWQLSFLALLGIIYLYPLLRWQLKSRYAFLDFLLDGLSLTVAAQLATWPIIAAGFQQLSVIAPLANLVAVWITPVILVGVFVAVLLSVVWAWWLWWLVPLLALKYLISVAVLAARLPGASVTINELSPIFLPLYYAILSLTVYFINHFIKKKEKSIMSNDKSNFLW